MTVNVEGDGVLCSLNSPALSDGCGVGLDEQRESAFVIYPNPGSDLFHFVLPDGFGGSTEVELPNLAGEKT